MIETYEAGPVCSLKFRLYLCKLFFRFFMTLSSLLCDRELFTLLPLLLGRFIELVVLCFPRSLEMGSPTKGDGVAVLTFLWREVLLHGISLMRLMLLFLVLSGNTIDILVLDLSFNLFRVFPGI